MSNAEIRMTNFKEKVLKVVRNIPSGETMTYGEVAEAAGRPGAARAVGNIMSRNYNPGVPCHRVILSDGRLGGYNRGGSLAKKKLLENEHSLSILTECHDQIG